MMRRGREIGIEEGKSVKRCQWNQNGSYIILSFFIIMLCAAHSFVKLKAVASQF